MTVRRYSGCLASRPRASRLWVLPPPMAWVSLKTPWVVLPSSRRKPSVRRMRMPSVTWFSRKKAAGSMRSWMRSERSRTVSRRAESKMLSRGLHAWASVFMGSFLLVDQPLRGWRRVGPRLGRGHNRRGARAGRRLCTPRSCYTTDGPKGAQACFFPDQAQQRGGRQGRRAGATASDQGARPRGFSSGYRDLEPRTKACGASCPAPRRSPPAMLLGSFRAGQAQPGGSDCPSRTMSPTPASGDGLGRPTPAEVTLSAGPVVR